MPGVGSSADVSRLALGAVFDDAPRLCARLPSLSDAQRAQNPGAELGLVPGTEPVEGALYWATVAGLPFALEGLVTDAGRGGRR